jgi:hypothetical protein
VPPGAIGGASAVRGGGAVAARSTSAIASAAHSFRKLPNEMQWLPMLTSWQFLSAANLALSLSGRLLR